MIVQQNLYPPSHTICIHTEIHILFPPSPLPPPLSLSLSLSLSQNVKKINCFGLTCFILLASLLSFKLFKNSRLTLPYSSLPTTLCAGDTALNSCSAFTRSAEEGWGSGWSKHRRSRRQSTNSTSDPYNLEHTWVTCDTDSSEQDSRGLRRIR